MRGPGETWPSPQEACSHCSLLRLRPQRHSSETPESAAESRPNGGALGWELPGRQAGCLGLGHTCHCRASPLTMGVPCLWPCSHLVDCPWGSAPALVPPVSHAPLSALRGRVGMGLTVTGSWIYAVIPAAPTRGQQLESPRSVVRGISHCSTAQTRDGPSCGRWASGL